MSSVYDIPFWDKSFYDHKARWIHYYNQVRFVADEVKKRRNYLKNFKLLEVGPSHGFVTSYLRKFGVDVTTIDNKKEYSPDVLGTVLNMPFSPDSFDMTLVCEVLEHMPYNRFFDALSEIRRVTKNTVLLSSPDSRSILFGLKLKVPFLKWVEFIVKTPILLWKNSILERGHYWEVGAKNYSLERIRRDIVLAGFTIERSEISIDTPKNHYFLLKRSDNFARNN